MPSRPRSTEITFATPSAPTSWKCGGGIRLLRRSRCEAPARSRPQTRTSRHRMETLPAGQGRAGRHSTTRPRASGGAPRMGTSARCPTPLNSQTSGSGSIHNSSRRLRNSSRASSNEVREQFQFIWIGQLPNARHCRDTSRPCTRPAWPMSGSSACVRRKLRPLPLRGRVRGCRPSRSPCTRVAMVQSTSCSSKTSMPSSTSRNG